MQRHPPLPIREPHTHGKKFHLCRHGASQKTDSHTQKCQCACEDNLKGGPWVLSPPLSSLNDGGRAIHLPFTELLRRRGFCDFPPQLPLPVSQQWSKSECLFALLGPWGITHFFHIIALLLDRGLDMQQSCSTPALCVDETWMQRPLLISGPGFALRGGDEVHECAGVDKPCALMVVR